MFPCLADNEVHVNATRVLKPDHTPFDTSDPWERAAAEAEGRRQAFLYEATMRANLRGFDRARGAGIGPGLGVHENWLIFGQAVLCEADVMAGVAPAYGITFRAWPFEDHAQGRTTIWRPLPDGAWCGIPLGSLIPVGFENLLVVGRCLSAEHSAQGLGAHLARLPSDGRGGWNGCRGGLPRVAALQARLREEGTILHDA